MTALLCAENKPATDRVDAAVTAALKVLTALTTSVWLLLLPSCVLPLAVSTPATVTAAFAMTAALKVLVA